MNNSVRGEFWFEVDRDGATHELDIVYVFTPGNPRSVEIAEVWLDRDPVTLTEQEAETVKRIAMEEGEEQWRDMQPEEVQ